jgi:hypothetical protein
MTTTIGGSPWVLQVSGNPGSRCNRVPGWFGLNAGEQYPSAIAKVDEQVRSVVRGRTIRAEEAQVSADIQFAPGNANPLDRLYFINLFGFVYERWKAMRIDTNGSGDLSWKEFLADRKQVMEPVFKHMGRAERFMAEGQWTTYWRHLYKALKQVNGRITPQAEAAERLLCDGGGTLLREKLETAKDMAYLQRKETELQKLDQILAFKPPKPGAVDGHIEPHEEALFRLSVQLAPRLLGRVVAQTAQEYRLNQQAREFLFLHPGEYVPVKSS